MPDNVIQISICPFSITVTRTENLFVIIISEVGFSLKMGILKMRVKAAMIAQLILWMEFNGGCQL